MANTNILQLPVAVSLDGSEWTPIVQGTGSSAVTRRATTEQIGQVGQAAVLPGSIEFTIDGAGANISSRVWGYLTVPFNATLTSVVLLADQTGSISMDVWKCTYSQFNAPTTPSVANSITGSNPPVISSSNKYVDDTLSNWDTSLSFGDVLAFQVPTPSTSITRVTLSLNLTRVV